MEKNNEIKKIQEFKDYFFNYSDERIKEGLEFFDNEPYELFFRIVSYLEQYDLNYYNLKEINLKEIIIAYSFDYVETKLEELGIKIFDISKKEYESYAIDVCDWDRGNKFRFAHYCPDEKKIFSVNIEKMKEHLKKLKSSKEKKVFLENLYEKKSPRY